jgi:spore maturation protein CgeB
MHEGSRAALSALAQALPIKIWGSAGSHFADPSLQMAYQGEAWGNKMYYILAHSQITINRHADVAENYANNMRLFEATGCGSLLITDSKKNLNKFFIPDKEIITYHSPQELVNKVQYYLSHQKIRSRIAKAGQARTLRDHTYNIRMQELVNIIERYL